MKHLFYTITALTFTGNAVACSCMSPPPVTTRAESSSAVFVGRIVSEKLQGDTRIYTFDTTIVLKGDLSSRVLVSTHRDGATCGSKFAQGANYLVFARGEAPHALTTGLYSDNRDISSEVGSKELEELNKNIKQDKPSNQPSSQ